MINHYIEALIPDHPAEYTLSTILPSLRSDKASLQGDPRKLRLLGDFSWILIKLRQYDAAKNLFLLQPEGTEREAALAIIAADMADDSQKSMEKSRIETYLPYYRRFRLSTINLIEPSQNLPALINISLSENCFFRCKMCHKWKNAIPKDRHLPFLDWQRFLATIPLGAEMTINFAGAEPLIESRIPDLIATASERGVNTAICTNGYLLDHPFLERLCEAGLAHIALSLDSTDSAIHDFLRGMEGSFERVLAVIEACSERKYHPRLELQPTINRYNYRSLIDFIELSERHRSIEGVNFLALVSPHNANTDDDWYRKDFADLWPDDIGVLQRSIDALIEARGRGRKISNAIPQLRVFQSYYTNPQPFIRRKTGCPLGGNFLNINLDGSVELCPFQHDIASLGSIVDRTLEEIWADEKLGTIKKAMADCRVNCHLILNCSFERENVAVAKE